MRKAGRNKWQAWHHCPGYGWDNDVIHVKGATLGITYDRVM